MTKYVVFPNLFDNTIIFLQGHCDYWGADYIAVPFITELIDRNLPEYKRKSYAPATIAILHTAPAVISPAIPAKSLPVPTENEQKFRVYSVNASAT